MKPKEFIDLALLYVSDMECLVWPFGKGSHGYGVFRNTLVHRMVCKKIHGKPTKNKTQVAHSCGNRSCVNPQHLRWATRKENEEDKIKHGKSNHGQRNGQTKLKDSQVLKIRSLNGKMPQKEIAERFKINQSNVSRILRNETWKGVKNATA